MSWIQPKLWYHVGYAMMICITFPQNFQSSRSTNVILRMKTSSGRKSGIDGDIGDVLYNFVKKTLIYYLIVIPMNYLHWKRHIKRPKLVWIVLKKGKLDSKHRSKSVTEIEETTKLSPAYIYVSIHLFEGFSVIHTSLAGKISKWLTTFHVMT